MFWLDRKRASRSGHDYTLKYAVKVMSTSSECYNLTSRKLIQKFDLKTGSTDFCNFMSKIFTIFTAWIALSTHFWSIYFCLSLVIYFLG